MYSKFGFDVYPLKSTKLTLSEIAKYWAREIHPPALESEILDSLLAAYWRGEFRPEGPDAPLQPDDARLRLLRVIARDNTHPEILFIREGDVPPPEVIYLPDGGAIVEIATRVPLPDREDNWPALKKAFAALASAKSEAYSQMTGPILFETDIEREAFAAYCAGIPQPLPKFWFASQRQATRASDLRKAAACFEAVLKSGKRMTRKEAFGKLKEVAPSLSQREFGNIWHAKAPPHWSRAGRPRTTAISPKKPS